VGVVIGVIAAVVVVALVVAFAPMLIRAVTAGRTDREDAGSARTHPAPPVAEFHVTGERAMVSFDVPLPAGEIDDVLRDLLVHEAIEVVREKRHSLPIDDVHEVVALGKRGTEWVTVGSVGLDTPGELPPPVIPTVLRAGRDTAFDPFDRISELPSQAPGLASVSATEQLGALADELRLPAALEAGLRGQGIDPAAAGAGELVLGVMRLSGYSVTSRSEDTHDALRAGQRTLVRLVPHSADAHPELDESEIRRFAVDFASSGADRGLLITEKFGPFEVYDRERREPRCRFITRERLQDFVDALALD
jgi:hypothetical protein